MRPVVAYDLGQRSLVSTAVVHHGFAAFQYPVAFLQPFGVEEKVLAG